MEYPGNRLVEWQKDLHSGRETSVRCVDVNWGREKQQRCGGEGTPSVKRQKREEGDVEIVQHRVSTNRRTSGPTKWGAKSTEVLKVPVIFLQTVFGAQTTRF